MPNSIKFSASAQTLALKKGNFFIGTGDVGKGPTSTTGYFNCIPPPAGGYTIYLNKETNGPSIYTAASDAELVALTNKIAGASYTTIAQCFSYFFEQTDKIIFNRDYEGIVTNGLVLNLDAGFTPSYPRSGTTWSDLAGSNNGTLTNGPTFNSGDGGSIFFDGTDDFVNCGNNSSIQLIGDMTIVSWIKVTNFSNFNGIIGKTNNNIPGSYDYYLLQNTGIPNFWRGNGTTNTLGNVGLVEGTNPPIVNVWQQISVVTKLGTVVHYLNGNTNGSGILSTTIGDTNNNLRIGNRTDNVTPFRGNISLVQIYNRALSATEVLQNYNVQKGRFGL